MAIQLKRIQKTMYSYQRLRYCTKCEIYTSFPEGNCMICNRPDKLVQVSNLAITLTKFRFHIIWLILASLFCLALILCNNPAQIAFTILIFTAITFFLKYISAKYFQSEMAGNLLHIFKNSNDRINSGLDADMNACKEDMNMHKYKDAYEKLRYISTFLTDDEKKVKKLICLDHFILRKDMDLEMESLILYDYNIGLVYYIYELSKVNRSLIKSKAIDYIIKFEEEILEIENSYEILGSIAGAVLKTQQHLTIYMDFVMRYLKYLKRERVLRLCKLLKSYYVDEWAELKKETHRIVNENYFIDPEFKEFIV